MEGAIRHSSDVVGAWGFTSSAKHSLLHFLPPSLFPAGIEEVLNQPLPRLREGHPAPVHHPLLCENRRFELKLDTVTVASVVECEARHVIPDEIHDLASDTYLLPREDHAADGDLRHVSYHRTQLHEV